jgi:hypothetical protein
LSSNPSTTIKEKKEKRKIKENYYKAHNKVLKIVLRRERYFIAEVLYI